MTQQPILMSISRIIRILRDEGSLNPGELLSRVDSSRKTFYRALNTLLETGVVTKQGGKYYWYEFVDTQVYGDEFEAKGALEHSRRIATGLKYLLGNEGTYTLEGQLIPDSAYSKPALMHLKTAYSGIHETFQESESIIQEVNEMEAAFKRQIKTKILESSSLQTQYPERIAEMVLSDIKEGLRGRKPYFLEDLRVQDKEVKSGSYTSLVKNVNMFVSLRRFMKEEETLGSNLKNCAKIVELDGKYYSLRQNFVGQLGELIMQVENGTPLKGKCHLCPKVRIASLGRERQS